MMRQCLLITFQRFLVLPDEPIDVAQGFVDGMGTCFFLFPSLVELLIALYEALGKSEEAEEYRAMLPTIK